MRRRRRRYRQPRLVGQAKSSAMAPPMEWPGQPNQGSPARRRNRVHDPRCEALMLAHAGLGDTVARRSSAQMAVLGRWHLRQTR